MTCKHQHGDDIGPLMGWVCGQCFTVIGERPKRYGMRVRGSSLGDKPSARPRQEIIWQAEILKSAEGTTLSVFLAAVARRFCKLGQVDLADAYALALDAVKHLETHFGSTDHDWSRNSAVDIADEEMSYWDHGDAAGSNT